VETAVENGEYDEYVIPTGKMGGLSYFRRTSWTVHRVP